MAKYASKIVAQAKAWIGKNESDGTHKAIIDIYNSHKPLARGYAVKYTDSWCATFISALSIKLGYTDIIPTECGCPQMIDLFKRLGCWVENENVTPAEGWILFYHWKDNGVGDCKGQANHVGVVEKVSGSTITIIEGNYKDAVKRRTLTINAKYMRGYAVPKYDKETTPAKPTNTNKGGATVNITLNVCKKGSKGEQIKTIQRILYAMGYKDQNGKALSIDGDFGSKTDYAVRAFQKANGLVVDGSVGSATWTALLK